MKETFLEKSFHGKRRGQAELLGLVFIVLLLILALLFYVKFGGQDNGSSIEVRSNIRVNNMLNSLMLVSVGDEQMKDVLIRDCGEYHDDSNCNDVRDLMKELLDRMKEKDRENYELELSGGLIGDSIGIGCSEESISATPAIFSKKGQKYVVKLKLCST